MRSATIFLQENFHFRNISIHALHAECDLDAWYNPSEFMISIHALHAECDEVGDRLSKLLVNFNPRTPCGVRLYILCKIDLPIQDIGNLREHKNTKVKIQ